MTDRDPHMLARVTCLSLLAHGALLWGVITAYRWEAADYVGFGPLPGRVSVVSAQQSGLKFPTLGEAGGSGTSLATSDLFTLLRGPEAEQVQPFLSEDPMGPTARSVVPGMAAVPGEMGTEGLPAAAVPLEAALPREAEPPLPSPALRAARPPPRAAAAIAPGDAAGQPSEKVPPDPPEAAVILPTEPDDRREPPEPTEPPERPEPEPADRSPEPTQPPESADAPPSERPPSDSITPPPPSPPAPAGTTPAPSPPSRPGRPGVPAPPADFAPRSDRVLDGFARVESAVLSPGGSIGRQGRVLKFPRPQWTLATAADVWGGVSFPLQIIFELRLDADGRVRSARLLKGSGRESIDRPLLLAAHGAEIDPSRDAEGKPMPDTIGFVMTIR